MISTELAPIALKLDDGAHRPTGLHVSRIINDIVKRLDPGRYDKHDKQGKPIPMDTTKVDAGLKYEQGLEQFLAKAALPGLFRPAPVKLDGVWMSPDGLVGGAVLNNDPAIPPEQWAIIKNELIVVEYKLTWYSSNKPCPDDPVFWPWLLQMKAYCKGLDTRFALLVPQFINGNYRPPAPVPPRRILIEWTQLEIDESWSMLLAHAKSKGWL